MAKSKKNGKQETRRDGFLLVGIGASAGGMKPLLAFFDNLPSECNMSFVVIQHFDPKHHSFMDKILSQHTTLEVGNVENDQEVLPRRVYLKPTDRDVIIDGKRLVLVDPPADAPAHLPIDTFFRSLADQWGEMGVCIVLSGTGRDGTLGLKAVKGAGGLTIVQAEEQAEYKGMPASAIGTGAADLILRVEKIPEALLRYARHPYLATNHTARSTNNLVEKDIRSILAVIKTQTGHDFSRYKRTTVRRRIDRRLVLHQIQSLSEYLLFLKESPSEVQQLFQDLTVTVTSFFRDPQAGEALSETLRETVIKNKKEGDDLRAWVIGCSTGEEAYSVAMLLLEAVEDLNKHLNLKLFATDINPLVLNTARLATYPDTIRSDVSEDRLKRFFSKRDSSYHIADRIREISVFALHDVTRDPPFSQLDLISCRNLLIYLDQSLQRKVLPLLHYGLNPGGVLFLGTAEGVGEFNDLFSPVDSRQRIFTALGSRRERLYDPNHFTVDTDFADRPREEGMKQPGRTKKSESPPPARRLVEKAVLEKYAPPAVLVDSTFRVLYLHGDADKYLRPPQGEPDWNILKMARKELYNKLRRSLQQALSLSQQVSERGLEIRYGHQLLRVDLSVTPLRDRGAEYLLITFTANEELTVPAVTGGGGQEQEDARVLALNQELSAAKLDLQATIEELETSNEELKSANEELQANNEELQSTNEELETSREELQSTNEELETVNAELHEKNRQLMRVNDDIENLFSTASTGSVFLDQEMRIKRFTPAVRKIFKLINTDLGRSLQDITSSVEGLDIIAEAQEVLETLNHKQLEIHTSDDQYFDLEIRPYRSAENIIEGIVIIFNDISRTKLLELEARQAQRYAESVTETIREPLIVLDGNLTVHSANRAFYLFFRTTPKETDGKHLYDLGNGQWDIPELRTALEDIIPRQNELENYRVEHDFPRIGRRVIALNARRIPAEGSHSDLILIAFDEIAGGDAG